MSYHDVKFLLQNKISLHKDKLLQKKNIVGSYCFIFFSRITLPVSISYRGVHGAIFS